MNSPYRDNAPEIDRSKERRLRALERYYALNKRISWTKVQQLAKVFLQMLPSLLLVIFGTSLFGFTIFLMATCESQESLQAKCVVTCAEHRMNYSTYYEDRCVCQGARRDVRVFRAR